VLICFKFTLEDFSTVVLLFSARLFPVGTKNKFQFKK
jgi:hypothetical protein